MKPIHNQYLIVTPESFEGYNELYALTRKIDALLQKSYDDGYDVLHVADYLVSGINAKTCQIRVRHGITQRRMERRNNETTQP